MQPRSQPGHTDGVGLQVPDAGLVLERLRQQRADRAEVDDVVRVRVALERAVAGRADQRMVAARLDAEPVRKRHLAGEAHAARTHDAALVVERDALGQRVELGRPDLRVARGRRRAVVRVVVVLQHALAGLVADAAVHRVVERDQLHRLLAPRPHRLGVGVDAHARGDRHVAGDLHPAAALRVLDLDDADAAVARDRQRRMPAEVRDEDAVRARRLEHGLPVLRHDRPAVDEDLRHGRPRARRRTSTACARSSTRTRRGTCR